MANEQRIVLMVSSLLRCTGIFTNKFEYLPIEGDRPVNILLFWVALLGNAKWIGGRDHLRLNITEHR